MTFPRFNDVYSQSGALLEPLVQGGVTIHLASPENRLVVRSHRLRLAPQGDGTHWMELVVDFSGRGRVVADVDLGGGAPTRLEDEVVLPPQTRSVVGRVIIARGEGGAYEVTPVELPASVPVAFESQLAGGLGDLCRTFAAFGGVRLDCTALEAGLSTAAVPLPEAGETYLVPGDRLGAAERERLDDYLARARQAG
jgi:hypothetical protein